MALPDFFVIGAPKAGTTALHVALASHPQLYLSRVKEPKHFLTDGPPPTRGGPGDAKTFREYVWRRDEYEALFADAPDGMLRGESTPFYLYDAAAQQRIREAVPRAKLIAVLRDPIDRAHSNWTHLWSAGLEPEGDFVRACHLEAKRAAAGWAPFWRYLDLGRYGEQVARLHSNFPAEQVMVLRYMELREEPVKTIDRILDFLGVPTGHIAEVPAQNVTAHVSGSRTNKAVAAALRAASRIEQVIPQRWWRHTHGALSRHLQREQRMREPLSVDAREALVPLVAEDIGRLERVLGQPFSAWLDTGRQDKRPTLRPQGRIGTAHGSIDRPLGD